MRWILRVLLFPVRLVLTLVTWTLSFLLGVGNLVLGILVTLILFGAVACFLAHDFGTMIAALVIAFLVSPFGLPLIGAVLIEMLRGFNRTLRAI
ncbi:MAG: CD1845 family protein [Dialister sp.]|nr:CD1845 family protein [Dialister sp.]